MKIAGMQANSFVDYEGHIAAVIFLTDCNMRCWYCHNKYFLNSAGSLSEEELFEQLERKKTFLDGVVVTGGEPTVMVGIVDFIIKIKELGLDIKLDTNGTHPEVIEALLPHINYIAMDIKAPLDKYKIATCTDDDMDAINKSIDIIMASGLPYEFRTTFIPQLSMSDIESIAERIKGAEQYALQQYVPRDDVGNIVAIKLTAHKPDFIREVAAKVACNFKRIKVRGI